MAARLRSTLWPIATRARPSLRVPGLIADFPLPGAEVALGIANPLVFDRTVPVAIAADLLKQSIDTASVAADAVLGRLPETNPEGVWMRLERAS
jgi:hypothetical protein